MYSKMYDEKHRMFGLSTVPSQPVRFFQKGLRERLLCKDCEQKFSRHENYARGVFYGNTVSNARPHKNFLLIQDLSYQPLKLFFLSLLWRFGVTSIEAFNTCNLGPHEEKLRKMLHADDPGDYLTYPCMVFAITWNRKHVSDLIVPPCVARMDARWIWSLVVGGFLLSFDVASHPPPRTLWPAFLKPDGTMILQIEEITKIQFLHRFASDIAKAQRSRNADTSCS